MPGFSDCAPCELDPLPRQLLGSCPPRGDGQHHYLITVIALDADPTLPAGLTREEFLNAARGHHLAASSISGLVARGEVARFD